MNTKDTHSRKFARVHDVKEKEVGSLKLLAVFALIAVAFAIVCVTDLTDEVDAETGVVTVNMSGGTIASTPSGWTKVDDSTYTRSYEVGTALKTVKGEIRYGFDQAYSSDLVFLDATLSDNSDTSETITASGYEFDLSYYNRYANTIKANLSQPFVKGTNDVNPLGSNGNYFSAENFHVLARDHQINTIVIMPLAAGSGSFQIFQLYDSDRDGIYTYEDYVAAADSDPIRTISYTIADSQVGLITPIYVTPFELEDGQIITFSCPGDTVELAFVGNSGGLDYIQYGFGAFSFNGKVAEYSHFINTTVAVGIAVGYTSEPSIQATLYYKVNGGTMDDTDGTKNIPDAGYVLETPTRSGFTFGGWFTDQHFVGEPVSKITAAGTYTLYAKWIGDDVIEYFQGKYVSIMGDSISTYEGTGSHYSYYTSRNTQTSLPNSDKDYYLNLRSTDMWWMKLIDDTGAIFLNNESISGSALVNDNDANRVYINGTPDSDKGRSSGNQFWQDARIAALAKDGITPEIILIYAGTNDLNATLGTFDPASDYAKGKISGTPTNAVDAYCLTINKIISAYPDAQIVMLIPFGTIGSSSSQEKVAAMTTQFISIANHYGIPYVETKTAMTDGSFAIPDNKDGSGNPKSTGVHPNKTGLAVIEQAVLDQMKTQISAGYKVAYFSNEADQNVITLSEAQTKSSDFTLTDGGMGQGFAGWGTTTNSGVVYEVGDTVSSDKNGWVIRLFAQYDPLLAELSGENPTYNGSQQLATLVVKSSDGETVLNPDQEGTGNGYKVEYYATTADMVSGNAIDTSSEDAVKDAGTYYIKVSGTGTYADSGSVTVEYTIEQATVDVQITTNEAEYTGSPIALITDVTLTPSEGMTIGFNYVLNGTYPYVQSAMSWTDVGTYPVYWKVTSTDSNYADRIGACYVNILPNGGITVTATIGTDVSDSTVLAFTSAGWANPNDGVWKKSFADETTPVIPTPVASFSTDPNKVFVSWDKEIVQLDGEPVEYTARYGYELSSIAGTAGYSGENITLASLITSGITVKANGNTIANSNVDITLYSDEERQVPITQVKNAGTYYLRATVNSSGSASYIGTIDGELIISPKALTLTPQNITLTYGDAVPDWAQSCVTAVGLVNGETLESLGFNEVTLQGYITDGTGFGTTRNASSTPYEDVVILSDDGKTTIETALTNYDLTGANAFGAGDLTVNAKPITIAQDGTDTISNVYSNSTDASAMDDKFAITNFTTTDLLGEDTLAAVVDIVSQTYSDKNVADDLDVAVVFALKTGVVNYSIANADSKVTIANNAITAKSLTIGPISFNYSGEALFTYSGFETGIGQETVDLKYTAYSATSGDYTYDSTGAQLVAGKYHLELQGTGAGNYSVGSAGTMTILPIGDVDIEPEANTQAGTATVSEAATDGAVASIAAATTAGSASHVTIETDEVQQIVTGKTLIDAIKGAAAGSDLTIITKDGSVTIKKDDLPTVEANQTVGFLIEASNEAPAGKTYTADKFIDASVLINNQKEAQTFSSAVNVTVQFDTGGKTVQSVKVMYLPDSGSAEEMSGVSFSIDGTTITVVYSTTHFSDYAVILESEQPVPPTPPTPTTTYKVTYNANGGTGAPEQQKSSTTSITLSSDKPTRTGYTFGGWSLTATGDAMYQPGETIRVSTTNTTLYAVWTDTPIAVESVKLDKTSASMAVGGIIILEATVLPEDATERAVTWTSSNPAVATVENGKVTAVAVGKVTITATAGGKSASCAVTVDAAVVIDAQTTVKDGKATVTDPEAIEALVVLTAATGQVPEVKIVSTTAKSVEMPTDLVTALAAGDGILEFQLAKGKVTMPATALYAIDPAAESVTFLVDETTVKSDMKVSKAYALCVQYDGVTKDTVFGTAVDVVVDYKLGDGEKADDLKVYYIPSEGSAQLITGAAYADGKVSFRTTHFSDYAIVFESSQPTPSGGSSDNTMLFVVIGIVVAIFVIGAAVYFMRNKSKA